MTARCPVAIVCVMEPLTANPQVTAISVDGVTKRYGELTAVDDLSFTVRSGAVTGFLGPNGAGKTTVLKMIAGLARPTSGRVVLNGASGIARAPDSYALGACIEPCGAHPGRTGRDHLRSLAAMIGLAHGRVDEILAMVELEAVADRRAGTYSMGMRQRLGLAAAVLGDPAILVLDEPLNGLDPQGIRWLRVFLRERAAAGGAVLLSSHVLTEAAQTVDDIVVIDKGRVLHRGTIADLERTAGGGVLVRTPMWERLAAVVRSAGGEATTEQGGAGLVVRGLGAARIGELAHDERIVLHELAARRGSLEDVFFSLTETEAAA